MHMPARGISFGFDPLTFWARARVCVSWAYSLSLSWGIWRFFFHLFVSSLSKRLADENACNLSGVLL
jgi:hypothetical protein